MQGSWLLLSVAVISCDKKPPAPPAFSLATVAGTWNVRAMADTGGAVLAEYQMSGTADPASWTMTFPNRPPMRLKVSVDADSLMVETPPYPSILREGVAVVSKGVHRLRDGKLVGTFVAKYATRMVDSVLTGRTEGTRAP
jgi:hypothetical protein